MSVPAMGPLLCLLIVHCSTILAAENVCPIMENYTFTTMETYTEPVVVNTFTWCLEIPPRCPKTRTEMRQRYRVKSETKTRPRNECCEGYKLGPTDDEETGIKCVPFCEKCVSGVCISPNLCQCIPGYHGDSCETACPPGTWGSQCKEKCNCTEDVPCNPINGHCDCPPGLRGRTCNETCPDDHWGPQCKFPCNCNVSSNKCHPRTGECIVVLDENRLSRSKVPLNFEEDPRNFTDPEGDNIWRTTDSTTEKTVNDHETPSTDSVEGTSPGTTSWSTTDRQRIRTLVQEESSSTVRPVIVLVSLPERRRNHQQDLGNFGVKNSFVRPVNDDLDLRRVVQPKTDYVKNIHKEVHSTPIPLDIALIVVASIVSLGLTSVAVVMVLHMRSKLLEATRISIYEEGKGKGQENPAGTRISSIIGSSLPQTPVRLGPLFSSTMESRATIPADSMELCNDYANGAATLSLRSFNNNFHCFPRDDHYDRPPATRIRLQNDVDPTAEHVYDEIPLQPSPFSSRKDA